MQIPHPFDPHRPPDWRLCRCQYLVERGESPTRRDDAATLSGWHYLSLLRGCRDDQQQAQLGRDHAGLHAAHTLRGRIDDLRRMGVEGYLLAGVLPDDIDTRFGLLRGTSQCYEQQFFDVRDCLNARDHVINVVIGLNSRELTVQDAEVFIRYFGFIGGRYVADAVIDFYAAPLVLPVVLDRLAPAERDRLRQRIQVHLAILVECLPVASTTLRQWLVLQPMIERLARLSPAEWSGLRDVLSSLFSASEMSAEFEGGRIP